MVWEIGMELIMHLNNLMHLPLALEPSAALSLVCKTLPSLILGLFPASFPGSSHIVHIMRQKDWEVCWKANPFHKIAISEVKSMFTAMLESRRGLVLAETCNLPEACPVGGSNNSASAL